jgi:hypothetical protein
MVRIHHIVGSAMLTLVLSDNAEGREEERATIMKHLTPIQRPPLESLRVVHATDVEFRHMCAIPTRSDLLFATCLRITEFFLDAFKYMIHLMPDILASFSPNKPVGLACARSNFST